MNLAFEPIETTWGQLVNVKQGKYVAKSQLSTTRSDDTGVPAVGANGVLGYVPEASYDRRVPLVTCRGSNCGLIQFPLEPVWVSNNAMALDAGSVDENKFIYYLALNTNFYDVISGSAQPQITAGPLKNKSVRVPPRGYWRAIAATLGALDDKIESNQLAITKAQKLGDALFMASSNEQKSISAVGTITMGTSPKGETLNEIGEGVPFYQGTRDFGYRFPSLRVWTERPIRRAQKNDTLLSVRAPVGELNRALTDCCIGRGVAAIHNDSHPSTLYYAMRASASTWDRFQGEGTVFASVNKKDVHSAMIRWASDDSVETLEPMLAALDTRIESLEREIQNLSQLRDALLPELLAGRIKAEGIKK